MAITWNMKGLVPERKELDGILQKDVVHHDMYVFASQEACRSIAKSMVIPGKEKLNNLLLEYFAINNKSNEFVMVNSIALAASHMIVIIRKQLAPYLNEIKND